MPRVIPLIELSPQAFLEVQAELSKNPGFYKATKTASGMWQIDGPVAFDLVEPGEGPYMAVSREHPPRLVGEA